MMPPLDMMQLCAPNVSPVTIAAIIRVESGGNPFAIGVNGPVGIRPRPHNTTEAAKLAHDYIRRGFSVDLGLMQINSRNLPGLGYTVEQILEPCNNLRAGSRILSRGYAGATRRFGPGQNALKAALSAYNTGNYEMGFKNGYVARYYPHRKVRIIVRATLPDRKPVIRPASPPVNPYTAETTVYRLVSQPAEPLQQPPGGRNHEFSSD